MTCRYTLKNGEIILMDICERFLEKDKKIFYHYPKEKDLFTPKNFVAVLIDLKTNKPYFEINGEQKYFSDYDYFSLDELIKKVHQGALSRGEIDRDQFVATLLKEIDNIGFIFYERPEQVFVPVDLSGKNKEDLEDKMTLIESEGTVIEVYTRDIFRLLVEGDVKVVNKNYPIKINPVGIALEKIFRFIRKPR